MVAQHYRWDFIGLSTDTKPTPQTSEKVTDGSTYYTSDNSKLYVWCKNQWYEKEVEGGGGGTTYTAGDGIDITNSTISLDYKDFFNIQPALEEQYIDATDYLELEESIIMNRPVIARDENSDPDFLMIRSSFIITSYVLNKVTDPEADMRDITIWGFDEMGQYFQAMFRWNNGEPTVAYSVMN